MGGSNCCYTPVKDEKAGQHKRPGSFGASEVFGSRITRKTRKEALTRQSAPAYSP